MKLSINKTAAIIGSAVLGVAATATVAVVLKRKHDNRIYEEQVPQQESTTNPTPNTEVIVVPNKPGKISSGYTGEYRWSRETIDAIGRSTYADLGVDVGILTVPADTRKAKELHTDANTHMTLSLIDAGVLTQPNVLPDGKIVTGETMTKILKILVEASIGAEQDITWIGVRVPLTYNLKAQAFEIAKKGDITALLLGDLD